MNEEQREKVERLLQIDPRSREGYQLKNWVKRWFRESDHKTATKQIDQCLKELRASKIEGFNRVHRTFTYWRQEILQALRFNQGF
ncbi:transposase [Pelagirhabdus alkalitolerans]|uniref:transposase n=1 Tax=Pelagirhabdus alkalitolerans TaxID=1612202 RepID=UPI000B82C1BC